jgi:hypothetical protein
MALRSYAAPCRLQVDGVRIDHHVDGAYAILALDAACPVNGDELLLDYRLMFDFDPQHRALVNVVTAAGTRRAVLGPSSSPIRIAEGSTAAGETLYAFWKEGVAHIFGGTDHVLFLMALLLAACSSRGAQPARARGDFGATLRAVVKVVTAFTAAHSATLALAAGGWIDLPSRWVEAGIALSVVIAALSNLSGWFVDRGWRLAFGFGLLHGLGFAGVIDFPDAGLRSFLLALTGFNAGVESGQLLIVAAFVPIAFAVHATWLYRQLAVRAGSVAIAAIATVWTIERAFDISIGWL